MKNKYGFTTSVGAELKLFRIYLEGENYALATIDQTCNYAGLFLSWLSETGLVASDVDGKLLHEFIIDLQGRAGGINLSRRVLLALRHYYRSIKIDHYPAAGMYVRGRRSQVQLPSLKYELLESVYDDYQILSDRDRRNKMLLGLCIYQGLTSGELGRIEVSAIDLKRAKVYVVGGRSSVSRWLDLSACQLLDLQEYLLVVRPRMLSMVGAHRGGRKPRAISRDLSTRLFFSENGAGAIKNSLTHLFRGLQKRYPKLSSAKVIRAVVISHWLKSKDLREVQYMAGHKYVSSTEQYNAQNLEALTASVIRHHPLS